MLVYYDLINSWYCNPLIVT